VCLFFLLFLGFVSDCLYWMNWVIQYEGMRTAIGTIEFVSHWYQAFFLWYTKADLQRPDPVRYSDSCLVSRRHNDGSDVR
jgi:hypothetical protein